MTRTGGCLCGAVRYEVRGPVRDIVICHCTECRRAAGVPWAATAARRGDLAIVQDEELRWVVSPRSAAGARRGFCVRCGSCLFWDAPGRSTISIGAGTLADAAGLAVAARIYVDPPGAPEPASPPVPAHRGPFPGDAAALAWH